MPKAPSGGAGAFRLRLRSSRTKLSRIGELNLLDQIRKTFPQKAGDIAVGIGDDAAVIKPSNKYLLATTDMMVEGVHFDLRFMTPFQLGFKLISVNVSDIFAMGGKPRYCLLNVAARADMRAEFIDMLFYGVKEAMGLYRTVLIGGDLSAADRVSLSATLIGYAGKYIRRSGARTGDRIYVTGTLGDSAGGLEVLKRVRRPVHLKMEKYLNLKEGPPTHPSPSRGEGKGGGVRHGSDLRYVCSKLGLAPRSIEPLLRRHLMPEARDPSRFVKCATSMIDVSDGLLIDLTRLCDESRAGARIYAENIPLSQNLKSVASGLGISPIELALSGGEDYELLFTAPRGKRVDASYIGDITESGRVIVDGKGRERPFAAKGYQHFGRVQ